MSFYNLFCSYLITLTIYFSVFFLRTNFFLSKDSILTSGDCLQAYNQPVPTDPDDFIIRHLNTFVTEYTNEFPSRNISLAFIDSAGQNKSVTHFLQPIPPPDYENFPKNPKSGSAVSKSSGFSTSSKKKEEERSEGSVYSGYSGKGDGLSKLMDACLRYVSLIPCYEVVESHVVTLLGVVSQWLCCC